MNLRQLSILGGSYILAYSKPYAAHINSIAIMYSAFYTIYIAFLAL